ncbi:hypothetical protein HYU23_03475 [Candidatus Woesearchaeota archaeon]|nr:hypothetical protein [Candidatus Woesearchaeota archaeon]
MGLFSFFKKKKSDKEEHTAKINEALKNSFSNVKKDILHIHKGISDHKDNTHKRFESIEKRLEKIEINLNILQQTQRPQKFIEKTPKQIEAEEETEELPEEEDILLNQLRGIPKAELKLFKTLYELQQSLNLKHISYKSLASYLYPGKDYNSIRSTITQFVLRLYTEGLIEKQRIGKENFIKLTPHGQKVIKSAKTKRMIKEIEMSQN